jgi:hypothetical protein
MRSSLRAIAGVTLIVGASATACSSAPGSTVSSHISRNAARASISAATLFQSSEQATLSWFYAMNHKDMTAAVSHFAPAAAYMMTDGYGGASAWPTFSELHCRLISTYGTTASVLCTFKELHSEPGTQVDNFWTVELQRQPDGRWLITNYGTG